MKIIEQSYEILQYPENPLEMVEKACRVCYNSESKIGCTVPDSAKKCPDGIKYQGDKDCTDTYCKLHSSHKLVKACINKGHESVLEHSFLMIRLKTNRGVMAELTRHRVGVAFAIQSTRYVKYDGDMEFIRPVWWYGAIQEARNNWTSAMQYAEDFYRYLLKDGWRPEMAREVLPNSLKTEIVMSGNYRSFRHLFKLRTSKAAHPQFRHLMLPLLSDLKERIPVIFDDIGE